MYDAGNYFTMTPHPDGWRTVVSKSEGMRSSDPNKYDMSGTPRHRPICHCNQLFTLQVDPMLLVSDTYYMYIYVAISPAAFSSLTMRGLSSHMQRNVNLQRSPAWLSEWPASWISMVCPVYRRTAVAPVMTSQGLAVMVSVWTLRERHAHK